MPNWLSGVDEEYATQDTFSEKNLSDNDLSDWLSGLDDEPGLPFEPMPTPDLILFSSQSLPNSIRNRNQELVADKSKLPDWLSDVDSQQHEDSEDMWKKSIEQEPASMSTEEPAPVSLTEDLPNWLQGVDRKWRCAQQVMKMILRPGCIESNGKRKLRSNPSPLRLLTGIL